MTETKKRQARSQFGWNADGSPRRTVPSGLLPNLNYKKFPPGDAGWLTMVAAQERLNGIHEAIVIETPSVISNWRREQGVPMMTNGSRVWIHEKNLDMICEAFLGTLILDAPAKSLLTEPEDAPHPESEVQVVTVPEHPTQSDINEVILRISMQNQATLDQHFAILHEIKALLQTRKFSQRFFSDDTNETEVQS